MTFILFFKFCNMFCLWYKMLFKHWCCLGVFTVTLSAVLKEGCVYPYIEKP